MQSPVKRIFFGTHIFDIYEQVYDPAEDSFLFADYLYVEKNARVLDVGTGCGILGILATEKTSSVVAVDLNPYAIRCTKANSILNNVREKITLIQADLLTPFDENSKFDLILFNAPYLPATEHEAETWMGKAWAGGIDGRQVIDRFIHQASLFLEPSGRILLMQSTLANAEKTINKFAEQNLKANILAERKLPFFETLTLVEATF